MNFKLPPLILTPGEYRSFPETINLSRSVLISNKDDIARLQPYTSGTFLLSEEECPGVEAVRISSFDEIPTHQTQEFVPVEMIG